MNNLVKVENVNMVEMTSNKIAEMTGKEHKIVMRDIRNLIESMKSESTELHPQDIKETTYQGTRRLEKNYTLSKDGVMLLITGYSVSHRMKLIKYCNELEKQLQNQFQVPTTFKEALILAVKQQDHIEKLELKIENDKARVGFAETIEKASSDILFRDMSKILANENIKLGQNKLYSWCRGKGLILSKGTMPSQRAVEQGLFRVTTRLVKTVKGDIESVTCKITGKGQVYILQKLKEELQIN